LWHATKVVKPGRTFVAHMCKAVAKLKKLHHVTRLSKGFKSNIKWWHVFITNWNGVSFITDSPPCLTIVFKRMYLATGVVELVLAPNVYNMLGQCDISIMAKELVLSCTAWGPLLTRTQTEFQCDNLSLVEAIQNGSSKMTWRCIFYDACGFSRHCLT